MVSGNGSEPASAERRLQGLGIELPPPPTPFGAYVEAAQTGNLLFLSSMLPVIGHEPKFVGRLGKELDANAGREAVRIAALNVLSAARQKLLSLDKITRVVRLCVYLANLWRLLRSTQNRRRCIRTIPRCFWRRQNVSPYGVRRGKSSLRTPVAVEVILEVSV
jgi:enamine deaminase RidA (YjgF/YER057c/UK114 family)